MIAALIAFNGCLLAAAMVMRVPVRDWSQCPQLSSAPPRRRRRLPTGPRSRRRARLQQVQAFPDVLDLFVAAIRAGLLPYQACQQLAAFVPVALRQSFDDLAADLAAGARFSDALGALDQRLDGLSMPLTDSLIAADRYGLPLAPVIDRLATEARQQRRRTADAAARQLPVRLAIPLVLCSLTSFVLLAIVPLLLGAISSLR